MILHIPKWGNSGWALTFPMVSSGLKCFRMRNDPFLGLHNLRQASVLQEILVPWSTSWFHGICKQSFCKSEFGGKWSIPKLDYQFQRVYRLVGHQSCPFLVGLVSRFPAVHRPLLTYVNTAFVAPAIGHQVGHFFCAEIKAVVVLKRWFIMTSSWLHHDIIMTSSWHHDTFHFPRNWAVPRHHPRRFPAAERQRSREALNMMGFRPFRSGSTE